MTDSDDSPPDSEGDLPHSDSVAWDAAFEAAFEPPEAAVERADADSIQSLLGAMPSVHLHTPSGESVPVVHLEAGGGDRHVGRYQILGEIARGGMGVVLKGRDPDLGRNLALKVLHERHAGNPQIVQRFIEEAQVAGQLEHPGILPIYELGVDESKRPYFTMKLGTGSSLSRLLSRRADPSVDRGGFLRIFGRVADAMAYAHARGVIHRDLKPANILVGSFGEVQVTDWGIAKVLARGGVADEASAMRDQRDMALVATVRTGPDRMESQFGSVLGTPGYMSPEQARGQIAVLDERTDVFALGAVLCEILTGRPAFVGESIDEIVQRTRDADLSDAVARIGACGADPEVLELARACLAAEASARPRDAGEVAASISRYLSSLEAKAHDAALAAARAEEQAVADRRSRRLTLAFGGTVLVGVIAAAAATLWVWERADDRQDEVEAQINDAMRTATDRMARGDPALATASLEEAEALAKSPDVSAIVVRRVEKLKASIGQATEGTRFTARLDAIASSEDASTLERDDPYKRAFADEGIDIDTASPDDVTAKWGRGVEIARKAAAALDDSVWRRRPMRGAPSPTTRHRLDLAKALDADPWRNGLRDAALAQDGARLRSLAQGLDPAALPAPSLNVLALSLIGANETKAAIDVLDAGARAHPEAFSAHYLLARCLDRHSDDPKDERILRHALMAIALRPDAADLRAFAAMCYAERGDEAEALRSLDEAAVLDPDGRHALRERSRALRRLGRSADALALLDKFAAGPADEPRMRYERVAVLLDLGRPDDARVALRRALDPDSALSGAIDESPAAEKPMTAAELPERVRPLFDALDRDGDGRLSGQELIVLRLIGPASRR